MRFTHLLLLTFFLFSLQSFGQLHTFKKYNHRNGLSSESTLSTAQDDKGYIWIGTDGAGLMQFNGHSFYEIGNYTSSNAIHVSHIYPIDHNHIYFASLFDGVYELKNNQYKYIYKPVSVGDVRGMSLVESNFTIISDYEIQLISAKGKLLKSLKSKNHDFRLKQLIKVPNAVIYLTNQGNFAVTKSKILKLSNWLKKFSIPENIDFATFHKNRLKLFHGKGKYYTEISISSFGAPLKSTTGIVTSAKTFTSEIDLVAVRDNNAFFHTADGELYTFEKNSYKHVFNNSSEDLKEIDAVYIDADHSFWINYTGGVIKITKEPFTKVASLSQINTLGIGTIYHVKSTNTDLISTFRKGLYIGSITGEMPFKNINMRAFGVAETKDEVYLATEKGIYLLKGQTIVNANFPYVNGKSCSMIYFDGEEFWYSAFGESLCRYNPKTKKSWHYSGISVNFPKYFYNGQKDFTGKKVYLGSNYGIWVFDKNKEKFTPLSRFNQYGSYCGNSIKDKFGTLWFTLDKAIVGITKSENYVVISDKKKLESTLLYTLNTDRYGNLLIGTNKGINVIKVDAEGNVLNQQNYSHFEGFEGYETNMRSSYQDDQRIYVGTIEGLFEINSSILEHFPVPPKPIISKPYEDNPSSIYNSHKLEVYSFSCILPKSKGISYSYRILGYSNKWSDLTKVSEISLPELSDGDYVLQVRATYDGIHFSPIATEKIQIRLPLYKNKWFLVLIVILLGILNLAFLEWSKNFKSNKTIDTKILTLDTRLIPKLIFFCFVASIILPLIINTVQSDFVVDSVIIFIQSGAILTLYFISKFAIEKIRLLPLIMFAAYGTYGIVILSSFYSIYDSNLHPYPVIQLCILTSVMPFLFSRIRIVIFTSVAQLVISVCLIIVLNETIYNELLFIIAVVISSALVVIFSFVRLDSLDKLIFVNGIINRGNVISISFDENNIITYCSENISNYFAFESEFITGKPTSIFNDIVVDEELRESKLTELFVDGKSINMPMLSKDGKLIWVEWACKELSQETKVIMGQDITEKLLISTNYESLVENAKDLIFNTDINGHFLFVNEFTKKLLGYREESLIGTDSLKLIVPEYQKFVQDFYSEQFKNRNKYSYLEYPIRNKAGKIFWLGQNLTLVFEPGSRDRVSGFMVLARDITEKRANDLLMEQQNKEIAQSIKSAKRIQSNLLPGLESFQSNFAESFIFFKPKDIVSGDFYWIEQLDNKVIVTLADCSGHGISGAFLTILGYNLLNQIVLERRICDADVIINTMGDEIQKALKIKSSEKMHREMDLLVLVFEGDSVSVASNGVGLIHASETTVQHYRNTINSDKSKVEKLVLQLKTDDTLYLLTDGYKKQSGALAGKKFGSSRLVEFIEKIHPESLVLQKKFFENTIRNWSEGHDQNDDITVIGLRNFKLPV